MKTNSVPTSTPWGHADHKKEIAPGIWQVSTPRHGGFYLSPERWRKVETLFPEAGRWAGAQWLEEDCEWLLAVLAFPECFPSSMVADAADGASMFPSAATYLASLAGEAIKARAVAFRASVAHLWRRGSLSSGPGRAWRVSMDRGEESKTVEFYDYPEKCYYSDEELGRAGRPGAFLDTSSPRTAYQPSLSPRPVQARD